MVEDQSGGDFPISADELYLFYQLISILYIPPDEEEPPKEEEEPATDGTEIEIPSFEPPEITSELAVQGITGLVMLIVFLSEKSKKRSSLEAKNKKYEKIKTKKGDGL